MAYALRANCGPRWTSGFLTMFMAFLLRENPIEGWSTELLLGVVIGAAGLGNTLGIALASVLKRVDPLTTVAIALVADAVLAAVTAAFYGVVTLGLLGHVSRASLLLAAPVAIGMLAAEAGVILLMRAVPKFSPYDLAPTLRNLVFTGLMALYAQYLLSYAGHELDIAHRAAAGLRALLR